MTLDQFLSKYRIFQFVWKTQKHLVCNDGFSVSVQCGSHVYSKPKRDNSKPSYYSAFELGFPSEKDDLLLKHAKVLEHSEHSIYCYVPREVVEELIAKHGGIREDI